MAPSTRSWAIAAIAMAFIAGALAVALVGQNTERRPSPPCPDAWSEDPRDGKCTPDREACHAFLAGEADYPVACAAHSRDGEALLQVSAFGSGFLRIVVHDGTGTVVFDQRYEIPAADDVELGGAEGAWRLEVTFEDARGDADIVLWG